MALCLYSRVGIHLAAAFLPLHLNMNFCELQKSTMQTKDFHSTSAPNTLNVLHHNHVIGLLYGTDPSLLKLLCFQTTNFYYLIKNFKDFGKINTETRLTR